MRDIILRMSRGSRFHPLIQVAPDNSNQKLYTPLLFDLTDHASEAPTTPVASERITTTVIRSIEGLEQVSGNWKLWQHHRILTSISIRRFSVCELTSCGLIYSWFSVVQLLRPCCRQN